MKWTKRDIGTVLMMGGFVYILLMMFLYPGDSEATMIGFALIGFGCVFGATGRRRRSSAQKAPSQGTKPKKKKKK